MTKAIWKATKVTGTLKWRRHEIPVKFNVFCDWIGRLSFSFQKIPFGTETLWLDQAYHSGGRYIEFLSLDGTDSIGQKIHTPYFILTTLGHRTTQRSSSMTLKGTTSWLDVVTVPVPRKRLEDCRTVSRYHIVGMKGFRVQKTSCDIGEIVLGALSKAKNYDEVTGFLDIVTDDPSMSIVDWVKLCDKKTDMILEIMSLAQDRRLDWTIRRVFDKGQLTSIFFTGPHHASPAESPPFSHLHLQPALELAAHSYTDYLRDKIGMGFAIEYFLMHPRFQELRFIAAMTGLEHLLQRFCSIRPRGGIVDRSVFTDTVLPALRNALNGKGLNSDELGRLHSVLAGINRSTLRENLFNFLEHHKVPLEGISSEQIANLVKVRNTLAHGRLYKKTPRSERLSDHLVLLHELMTRIFLALLKYSGNYWSYLNGQKWTIFPP